jgi:hypothetical protein
MSDADIGQMNETLIRSLLEEVLDAPDEFAFKDKLSLVSAVSMYLQRDIKVREANEPEHRGTKARAYGRAFKAASNAPGGRKRGAIAVVTSADDEPDTAA